MKVLVISSCSEKQEDNTLPACKLYIGGEHQYIQSCLKRVWSAHQYVGIIIDWHLVSTGHGLIHRERVLEPYDVSTKDSQILKSKKLHKDIEELIKDYDLVFFLLGKPFYQGQGLNKHPFKVSDEVIQIYLICTRTNGYREMIPEDLLNCYAVELKFDDGFRDIRRAKGFAFKKLCEAACRDGFQVFEDVKNDPQKLIEIALQEN